VARSRRLRCGGQGGTGQTDLRSFQRLVAHAAGYLRRFAGIELQAGPYRAIANAVADLISGAITRLTRAQATPDMPAVAEAFPGFHLTGFLGMAVPSATPRDVVEQLHALINAAQTVPGLIVAEAVMTGLAPDIGRQEAHDVVYDACRVANDKGIALADAPSADPRVTSRIGRATIDRLTSAKNYLGLAREVVDRVLAASKC
jgi:hypothetical protein